jgi:hypothetical protein
MTFLILTKGELHVTFALLGNRELPVKRKFYVEKQRRRGKTKRSTLGKSSSCPVRFGGLKVPKREIFDRSDFPDFYTIKSLRMGDFGVKIKKI